MKKILLPTDFSENSWNAIKYALQLYKNESCNFTFLNTYTPITYRLSRTDVGSAQFDVMDAIKEASNKGLEEIKQTIETQFNNPKHTFSYLSSFNTLITEINELYAGNVMDSIIMGTQGATGAMDVLFGTNTMHVIKNAKCPVLAIPSGFSFETPLEILFPSDYQIDFKDQHIAPLLDLASVYNSRINILHVNYGKELSEQQQKSKVQLANYFKETAHLFHVKTNKNVDNAINKFQKSTKINLLVMINNKRSFFENLFFKSTINQISIHLNIPFLIIPSKI
ncbi:universal stress protein [Lacinutrix salivirga]